MTPQELKSIMSSGLLSFPLTDFDAQGNFNAKTYAERLEWLAPYGASALFAAGGTGEFFSLTGDEYPAIIKTAVDTCQGKVPIIAGAGGPTRFAIQCAQEAERAGAHGVLLLPHYLTEAGHEGFADLSTEVGADGDVLQVGIARCHATGGGHELMEGGVNATGDL